jgi:hypothetical protein
MWILTVLIDGCVRSVIPAAEPLMVAAGLASPHRRAAHKLMRAR